MATSYELPESNRMDKQVALHNVLTDFLHEKFPYQDIEWVCYEGGAQPGDYKAPCFRINGHVIGWFYNNYTEFQTRSSPNAKDQYKTIKVADPNFLDIFHKMAVYELGYDPLKPGSRDHWLLYNTKEYEAFHPELYEIFYSMQ